MSSAYNPPQLPIGANPLTAQIFDVVVQQLDTLPFTDAIHTLTLLDFVVELVDSMQPSPPITPPAPSSSTSSISTLFDMERYVKTPTPKEYQIDQPTRILYALSQRKDLKGSTECETPSICGSIEGRNVSSAPPTAPSYVDVREEKKKRRTSKDFDEIAFDVESTIQPRPRQLSTPKTPFYNKPKFANSPEPLSLRVRRSRKN